MPASRVLDKPNKNKMYRFITLILLIGFFAFSCGKKDETTSTQNVRPQTQQQKSPQTNNQTSSTQKQSSSGSYYVVKNIGSSAGEKQFIDFSWSENDKEIKLSDYKGKVILLNFWATWCPPCKKELPALSEISKDLEGKSFQMIGVSVDENPDALVTFLKSNALPYTILHESTGLFDKYVMNLGGGQGYIPQTFIIDKNGKVVETIVGSRSKEDFVTLINKYL
jgi:thiol-disulfide isomerase/thioredoxin